METMSIYEELVVVKNCFEAVGDTGRTLQKLGTAMRGWVDTLTYCAEVDDRIQAKCQASKTTDIRDALIIARLARTQRQLEEGGI